MEVIGRETKFNKPTFNKIPKEKQDHILEVATKEFATNGFQNTNINVIAEKAGISIGSLYKYFASKKDLFLMTIHTGIAILGETLDAIIDLPISVTQKFEKVIRAVQKTSREKSDLIQLYSEMTAVGNAELVQKISFGIESISAATYTKIIKDGQATGEIRADIDPAMAAYLFDSLLMNLQFSYASDYFRERFKLYVAPDILERDDFVVEETMKFIASALLLPSSR
ncbi:TetR/AcrR family transcriptional regulator [uncultured Sphaerochaeta sp.]|uniref:TetR/AcrR family transcriptional regulator n=1 Tax=uncultured Sphaerochaeta sp. TaxID=886478 RepID=UPI002A0A2D61|nr:TetR/AcrR family transcriptional regulator [uncultured Sphaerochaeta sp.]